MRNGFIFGSIEGRDSNNRPTYIAWAPDYTSEFYVNDRFGGLFQLGGNQYIDASQATYGMEVPEGVMLLPFVTLQGHADGFAEVSYSLNDFCKIFYRAKSMVIDFPTFTVGDVTVSAERIECKSNAYEFLSNSYAYINSELDYCMHVGIGNIVRGFSDLGGGNVLILLAIPRYSVGDSVVVEYLPASESEPGDIYFGQCILSGIDVALYDMEYNSEDGSFTGLAYASYVTPPSEGSVLHEKTLSVKMYCPEYFEYRDENGENPIYDKTTGDRLHPDQPIPL